MQTTWQLFVCLLGLGWLGMLLLGGNTSTVVQRLYEALQLKPPFIKKVFKVAYMTYLSFGFPLLLYMLHKTCSLEETEIQQ